MAASEKVCEFGSDEYLGYEMRKHKKNLIQVNPSARHNFKNKKCTLIIHRGEWCAVNKERGKIRWSSTPSDDDCNSNTVNWYVKEWYYTLKFEQEELQGQVDGEYLNWTYDLGTTIRKLKRLVGGSKYMTVIREFNTNDNMQYAYSDIVKANT